MSDDTRAADTRAADTRAADTRAADGALNQRLSAAITAISPSLVQVHGSSSPVTASGIVWTADGIVLTAHSGTWQDDGVDVTLASGESHPAMVLGRDPTTDLLVLQISGLEAGGEVLAVPSRAPDCALTPGNLAIAVGRRRGGVRASWGSVTEVSGPWTTPLGGRIDGRIDVDAGLPRGLTGGALVDVEGRLLGLNTRRLRRGGATIPLATIDRVVAAIQEHGSLHPAWLGVGIMPVSLPAAIAQSEGQSEGQSEALIVLDVHADGPAGVAGWLQGDVLLKLGDSAIRSPRQLQSMLGPDQVGRELVARLVRAGQIIELAITPSARPEGQTDEHGGPQRHGRHRGHGRHGHQGDHGDQGDNGDHGHGHGRWRRGGRRRHRGHGGQGCGHGGGHGGGNRC